MRSISAIGISLLLAITPVLSNAGTSTKVLPEGTRVYFKLDQAVSGKRSGVQAGDVVQCSVWRDVVLQGVLLIKAGTHGNCRVESVKHANIAGVKGKIVIGALDTKAVDGQPVQMTGGYNKEGKSRMAMSISLGAVLFLPLIFITGSPANLPDGTVFDAYSGPDVPIAVEVSASAPPAINLAGVVSPMSAEVLLDDFMQPNAKPEVFKIKVVKQGPLTTPLVIDSVNGKTVDPMPLDVVESKKVDDGTEVLATIKIKTLAKQFQKGINRFEVATTEGGERKAVETILNIQM